MQFKNRKSALDSRILDRSSQFFERICIVGIQIHTEYENFDMGQAGIKNEQNSFLIPECP